jgi:hypothetical protein
MRLRRQSAGLGRQEAPADSADRLRSLYDLSGALLDLCLCKVPAPIPACNTAPLLRDDYASCLTRLLIEIANAQPDPELGSAVTEANIRLLPFRRAETTVLTASAEALVALGVLWTSRDIPALRILLRSHHDARAANAEAIMRVAHTMAGRQ